MFNYSQGFQACGGIPVYHESGWTGRFFRLWNVVFPGTLG